MCRDNLIPAIGFNSHLRAEMLKWSTDSFIEATIIARLQPVSTGCDGDAGS